MNYSRMTAGSFASLLSPLAGIAALLAGALPARNGLFFRWGGVQMSRQIMGRSKPGVLVLAITIAATAPMGLVVPSYGTIVINSSLELIAQSNAGGLTVTDTVFVSQGVTINQLGPVSVSALATAAAGSVLTTGTATATWLNPAAGQVTFDNLGWDIQNVETGFANVFTGSDWTYTFQADVNGFFTLNWNVTGAGTDTFGLNGFNFVWSGAGGNDFLFLNSAGTLTRPIVAGQQFTVNINNQANISGGVSTRTAFMDGVFDWQMDMIPGPATLTLLGLAGLMGTRRRCRSY